MGLLQRDYHNTNQRDGRTFVSEDDVTCSIMASSSSSSQSLDIPLHVQYIQNLDKVSPSTLKHSQPSPLHFAPPMHFFPSYHPATMVKS
jgi:hypothetical protein